MYLESKQPLYTGEELDAMHPYRSSLLELGASQIGAQHPDSFWSRVCPELMGQPHRFSWCGGWYLWCLTEVIPECKKWKWVWGKGFLQDHPLNLTGTPEPGDLAYFGTPYHHYAMVELVMQGKIVHTIDGNQGIAPEELVKRRHYGWSEVKAFYSIASLL